MRFIRLFFLLIVCSLECQNINTNLVSGKNNLALAQYLNTLIDNPTYASLIDTISSLSNPNEALMSLSPLRNVDTVYSSQNTMFAYNSLVTQGQGNKRIARLIGRSSNPQLVAWSQELFFDESAFVAQNDDSLLAMGCVRKKPAEESTKKVAPCVKNLPYVLRIDGFGHFINQDAEHQNPSFTLKTGGGLLDFEYYGCSYAMVGCAGGLARSFIPESSHVGKSIINSYTASLYAMNFLDNTFFEWAVWGTYNQYENKRNIVYPGVDLTVTSSHNGWQALGHFGVGYDSFMDWGVVEPFGTVDYVANWDSGFSEHGAGIYDMEEANSTSSMLRSEVGLRLYEYWCRKRGLCILKEKISYVNKVPFDTGKVTAALVGTPGSFIVETFTEIQNLAAVGLEIFFRDKNNWYFSATYEGEIGSNYLSNEAILEIGKYF